MASFIVLAIWSLGTSNRRCEYSHAMTLPLASTIVETPGTSPSTSWAEPLATTSDARFDISPNPPTTGNISPAATTLANRQHHASLMTVTVAGGRFGGRSGMPYRVTRSAVELTCRGQIASIKGLTGQFAIRHDRETARLSQKRGKQTVA